jgi:hypothetical protein
VSLIPNAGVVFVSRQSQKATETIGECMTQENFDKPISEYSDDDLNDKINLSSNKGLESAAPTTEGAPLPCSPPL